MGKKVSVIITTYKRNSISRAIESVLNQTYKFFEIIVVDDNGKDSKIQLELEKSLDRYISNNSIIYIKHDINKNGAAARNTGIKHATGQYIAFLDDDDYYLPERLEIFVNKLEENPDFCGAYSSVLFVQNKKIIGIGKATLSGKIRNEYFLGKFDIYTGSNLFFTKNALLSLNGFDESFLRHQDTEILLRFLNQFKLLAVKQVLVVKNSDDNSNLPSSKKMLEIKKKLL